MKVTTRHLKHNELMQAMLEAAELHVMGLKGMVADREFETDFIRQKVAVARESLNEFEIQIHALERMVTVP